MILSFINIRKVLGRLKSSGFVLGFQQFPRDLANVNERKSCLIPLFIFIGTGRESSSILLTFDCMLCLLIRKHDILIKTVLCP